LKAGIKDPAIAKELKLALSKMDDPDGKMAEYAENLLSNAGNAIDEAEKNAG
jgi:hypothetical protein